MKYRFLRQLGAFWWLLLCFLAAWFALTNTVALTDPVRFRLFLGAVAISAFWQCYRMLQWRY